MITRAMTGSVFTRAIGNDHILLQHASFQSQNVEQTSSLSMTSAAAAVVVAVVWYRFFVWHPLEWAD